MKHISIFHTGKVKKTKRIGAANKETVEHKIVRQSHSEKIQQTKTTHCGCSLVLKSSQNSGPHTIESQLSWKEREIFSDSRLPNTDCADVSLPPRGPEFSHKQKEVTLYA